jgi:hypothetical protein
MKAVFPTKQSPVIRQNPLQHHLWKIKDTQKHDADQAESLYWFGFGLLGDKPRRWTRAFR